MSPRVMQQWGLQTRGLTRGASTCNQPQRGETGEFMQEGIKADECPLAIISKEVLAPYKCSALSKGYLFPRIAVKLPGCHLYNGSREKPSSNSYSKKAFTMCRLPVVFLLGIILSASFLNSYALDPDSEERNCYYNMIGVAGLSCQYFSESSRLPSVSCCTSLLHAIDELPPAGESGECCLCRYTYRRVQNPTLATSYISCSGKDRAYVSNWTYPIQTCGKACKREKVVTQVDTPVRRDHSGVHGSITTKILTVAAVFLILLICCVIVVWLWWWMQDKKALPVRKLEMDQRGMQVEADSQIERRRSSGQVKERRTSSGRRRSLQGSPDV